MVGFGNVICSTSYSPIPVEIAMQSIEAKQTANEFDVILESN